MKKSNFTNNKKEMISIAIIAIFLVMIVIALSTGSNYKIFHSIRAIILSILILLFIAVFILIKKHVQLHYVYLLIGSVFGLLMLILIPLHMVPDEAAHIYTSYYVSNMLIHTGNGEDNSILERQDDSDFSLSLPEGKEEYYTYYWNILVEPLHNEKLVDTGNQPLRVPLYQYFAPAVGISLGRMFGAGTGITFLLGRGMNLLLFLILTFFAIKIIPFGKTLVMFVCLMPMTMQQAASFSYDTFINGISILIFSISIYLIDYFNERKKVSKREIILIVIEIFMCGLLFPLKGSAYFMISLLPLLIAYYARGNKKFAIGTIIANFLIILSFFIINKIFVAGGAELLTLYDNKYTIPYLLKHIRELCTIIYQTYYNEGAILYQIIGANLGSFTITINFTTITILLILLLVSGLSENDELVTLPRIEILYFWIVFIFSSLCIWGGMLLSWTEKGTYIIQGVQGRYFIPILLFPLITIKKVPIKKNNIVDKYCLLIYCISIFFTIVDIVL